MAWLPARGRDAQFQELKQLMAEDGVAFNGVFKFYEIRLALKVGDLNNAERLYIEAKKENNNMASSLDGETSDNSKELNDFHSFLQLIHLIEMENRYCNILV